MSTSIIEIKGIGKKYKINHEMGGYVALRDVITNIFKNPFAFLKTKTKQIIGMETKEVFWALKDINFTVEKGEVIGIIGRNGAGKSTLLKILSQITPPTTGEIKINGTVGSLLEVGTGFHPELTGRENIFLNGAILGMKRKDIVRKFDEIVKFADIEKFLDTPVKFYSSGMYVRLAFSVAAHMDTDILIIDEVLAVGDSEFQKKCLGKMNDITKNEGRTILFVSHNMATVQDLCKKTIWLDKGKIKSMGDTKSIVYEYSNHNYYNICEKWVNINHENKKDYFELEVFEIKKGNDGAYVQIEFNVEKINPTLMIGYAIYTENKELLYLSYQGDIGNNRDQIKFKTNKNIIRSKLPTEILNNGKYILEIIGVIPGKEWLFELNKGNPTLYIEIEKQFDTSKFWTQKRPGLLAPVIKWESVQLSKYE